ncbi:HAD hydrolase-like protein [Leucobacter sp. G161]|uniref:HAD hydrolase-like protein n=1 Tax=Leucobacter sp. G161 TaxID=663704 RepID=UPI00073C2F27|nr:HAD hydrolase-like protein [Leucobacter sp. G161]KUF07300.1 phosphatase [Leucobacter sp. G161]
METSAFSCILWDVDGTIADASKGMFARLTAVLETFGHDTPSTAELSLWMGPPMLESFQVRAGMNPEDAQTALTQYRELASREGYASSVELYAGVPEIVRAVAAADIPQSTASTKPEVQVRAILDHFGLLPEFTAISGARSGPEGQLDSKAFVIERALERLAAAGADISRPVLIGDRHHDVEGGAAHGIPVIFADWGFGLNEEAEAAAHHAMTPAELRGLILTAAQAAS